LIERIVDGISNHFPAQNALDRRILHTPSHNFSGGDIPGLPQHEWRRGRPSPVRGGVSAPVLSFYSDTNFRLARRRSPLSVLNETTTEVLAVLLLLRPGSSQ